MLIQVRICCYQSFNDPSLWFAGIFELMRRKKQPLFVLAKSIHSDENLDIPYSKHGFLNVPTTLHLTPVYKLSKRNSYQPRKKSTFSALYGVYISNFKELQFVFQQNYLGRHSKGFLLDNAAMKRVDDETYVLRMFI